MRVRWVYRSSLAVQILCGVVNFYVGVRVFCIAKSPVSYNVNVVQPQPFPTNSVFVSVPELPYSRSVAVNSSTNSSINPSSVSTYVPVRYSLPFSVFVDSGKTYFRSGGRDYAIGDTHAYGKVSSIYPERIYLSNGDYIDNLLLPSTPIIRSNTNEQRGNDITTS